MLGAAGRAAGGLVKQAVKAGNVSQILPTASVARKYPFIVIFTNCQMWKCEIFFENFPIEAAILPAE